MSPTDKKLTKRAKDLAQKFVGDCQALFDSGDMHDALYDSEVMQALVMTQAYAEDVGDVA